MKCRVKTVKAVSLHTVCVRTDAVDTKPIKRIGLKLRNQSKKLFWMLNQLQDTAVKVTEVITMFVLGLVIGGLIGALAMCLIIGGGDE